ncbi:uncharacterized protein K452DRAFT_111809 [Aplosporella prunicola CBS 121167]|uniref:Uncharacterized protein n=1 Tax=Aplosporella prunicola CBS 121167 TaxID=1176127 RepID=A0A6A6B0D3_9PEZI|nr:uncharacterized protein K452DRAFT_111809 [Aplosporella prunicola CBS 121167]KAF2137336.1 hypothetical protein K452DRAFT_111809 [Aplosporella prunicola CBS 121167]
MASSSSRQRSYDSLSSSSSMQSDGSAKRIRLQPAHFDDEEHQILTCHTLDSSMRLAPQHDSARLEELEAEDEEELNASSVRFVVSTSSRSSNEDRPISALQVDRIRPRDRSREEYVKALKQGYNQLIEVLLRDVSKACDTLVGSKTASVSKICYDVLASTENSVLHAILDGNLAWDAQHDCATSEALERLRAQAETQPCIYQRVLVDELNQSPTPAELFDVIEGLRRYARTGEWQLAESVDRFRQSERWNENLAKAGRRKYLAPLASEYEAPSEARIAELEFFCQHLHSRLDAIPTCDWHSPLRFPLVDMGYTVNFEARLAADAQHTSAKFLMNLVEAMCGVLFPNRYRVVQHPVYLIFEPQQAVMADLVLGQLAHALQATGGGFAYWPTDMLHASSMSVDDKNWARYEKWAVDHSPYVANCRADTPRQAAQLDRIKRVIEEKKREMFDLKKEYNEGQLQMRLAARDITRRVARCNRYSF